ncbi:calcium/sodium antiporter [Thiotrichales bacterium 19S3-7]|nr:calcium/sodium antiporter [Thiotrichales bacterium 19S3-7]MCF6801538.1 calcium/sodium antiporter [Thiotrichales bacterium 19S3-11]
MLFASLAILFGLLLLVLSADRFVVGAVMLAEIFQISPLVIGIFILGFGTSLPEIVISAFAAFEDKSSMAIGNAIGSNIANIGLVIGVAAVVRPIKVDANILYKDFMILIGISVLLVWMLWNLTLSRLDGIILLIIFGFIMTVKFYRSKVTASKLKDKSKEPSKQNLVKSILYIVLGLILLIISAKILIWGASSIGKRLGMSDLAIGLTIIAIGTSLPELATSAVAALKKQHDLALGNIIGSNIFNTLMVVGITVLISPAILNQLVLYRDALYMVILTLCLFLFTLIGKNKINRYQGAIFLISYFIYIYSLFYYV